MPSPSADPVPIQLNSLPGVKRDGTVLDGNFHTEALWCRWQRDRPRKIGGYRTLTNLLSEITRGMHVYDKQNKTYTHCGSASMLERLTIDPTGVTSSTVDRTPTGFPSDADNQWQFDTLYDSGGTAVKLIAHAAPNAADISDDTENDIYIGDVAASTALTASGMDPVSGGVVSLHPYLLTFGNDGVVNISAANDPDTQSVSARPTAAKIVRGMATRGAGGTGGGPAGLLWALDGIIQVTFAGGTPIFAFSQISPQGSILSSASVIEYDGIYYWVAIDRFLAFNGVVREVPNDMNQNFFFNNLNWTYRNKVFAHKVPYYGEIWWCFPYGSSTECNWAVVYNVRGNFWYDTPLPGGGRSSAQFAQVFRSPLMTGVYTDETTDKYHLLQHEFGVDAIDGQRVLAIPSYFETANFMFGELAGSPSDNAIVCNIIEPDFLQTGDMYVQVVGAANARAAPYESNPTTFPQTASSAQTQLTNIRETRRQIRFRFGSNVQGGDYQAGKILYHIQPGGGRKTQ